MRSIILAGPAFAVIMASLSIPTQAAPDVASPADVKALLAPWTGPHGGEPPFDKVKVAAFEPALREAMREQLAEVDKIADSKAAPSFDNTIVALERTGGPLQRVLALYHVWTGGLNTSDMQKVEAQKHNAAIDQLQSVVDRFNEQIKIYKAKAADKKG